MDPFGSLPLELISVGDRGKESRVMAVGLRVETAKGAGIYVGLHNARIHIMARGAVVKRHGIGRRSKKLTVAYLQLVIVPEPWGLSFEVRPVGELGGSLLTGSNRVAVLDGDERPRVTKNHVFKYQPVPGADVQFEVAGARKSPKVILKYLNPTTSSPPGKWRVELGMFLHASYNSVQVLIRKVRVATLPTRRHISH